MRWLSRLLVMALMVGSTSLWAVEGVLPGSGTAGDPYLIEDLADFDRFAGDPNYWGDYTRLETDVNLVGRTYTTAVIAPGTSFLFDGIPFSGMFDGGGHVINNLTIDSLADEDPANDGNDYLGLFGFIHPPDTEIKDLGIKNVNITGGDDSDYLGGLCGSNYGTITNCYSGGSVTGGDGSYNLGGLCGCTDGFFTNCYAAGSVTGGVGSFQLGGLCGESHGNTLMDCFWDIETSGMPTSDGGTGLPTAQMQTLSTFTDANWDFIHVWNIGENQTYPYIRTYSASDINKDRVVNVIDLSIIGQQWMGE